MKQRGWEARNGVWDLDELPKILGEEKSAGKRVVLCHGVFDLLHIGHIRHFEQAKSLGDVLVVTVTPDIYVNKGPNRPAFSQDLRAEAIAALDCVDYVAVNKWPVATNTIEMLCPDYYVKGSDYKDPEADVTGGIKQEEASVVSVGGKIVFTDDITFSSSSLINRHMPVLPKEAVEYLAGFSSRFSLNDVLRYLDGAKPLKVLSVGETIIDEYVYCEALGKSGKEPMLAIREISREQFAGGIVAVANHVSAFCDQPSLLTILGDAGNHPKFVREKLNPKIKPMFANEDGEASTIVKRRYIEGYPFQKLLEVYEMDDGGHKPSEVAALRDKLEKVLPDYDLVIVADYGHGMLGPEEVELLSDRSRFLAVNTQVNAGNIGFNTISKYPRADFICISENEVRLEARSRRRDLRDIVLDVSDQLACEQILLTRGQRGCLTFSKDEGFSDVPAFATSFVDRIGAGDSVLSVAAMCACQKAPMELVGFIGNAVGAEAVATVGNRTSIERASLIKHIDTLLK